MKFTSCCLFLLLIFSSLSYGASNTDRTLLTVVVFWEGETISPHNLEALSKIRRHFPDIQWLHFLSPVYFLDSDLDNNVVLLRKAIDIDKDQIGAYLAPWKPLVDKANIFYRFSPSFWGPSDAHCSDECGLAVPMDVYSYTDLDRLFQLSKDTLQQSKLPINQDLFAMAGGVNSSDIIDIASSHGYRLNFSPIPPSRVEERLGDYPIFQWLKKNWSDFESVFSPRSITAQNGQAMILVPQTLGFIDYRAPEELLATFKELHEANEFRSIATISVNSRTAAMYYERLKSSLSMILKYSSHKEVPLTFHWKSYRARLSGIP